ncbi:MAG: hypothetical protein ACT4PU_12540 [Planctomycetota bacterium]
MVRSLLFSPRRLGLSSMGLLLLMSGCLLSGCVAGSASSSLSRAEREALAPSLALLDAALLQRSNPELQEFVPETLGEARQALQALKAAPVGGSTAWLEAQAAVDMLSTWHSLQVSRRFLGRGEAPDDGLDPARQAVLDLTGTLSERSLRAVTRDEAAEPAVAQLQIVYLTLLFEAEQLAGARQLLLESLVQAPPDSAWSMALHRLLRERRHLLRDPAGFANAWRGALGLEGVLAITGQPLLPVSLGFLQLAAGLAAEQAGDSSEAARSYEQGLAALQLAPQGDALSSDWDVSVALADCGVNAARLRRERALADLKLGGIAAVRGELLLAEAAETAALVANPDDEEAAAGLAATADLYYQAGDLEGIRDCFGRLAQRFDRADWWNNYAFFCRETAQYEASFAAYERCIALAPDTARYVNDTGLILLYHLRRDLDRAEQLFRRAWALGREAAANPFASPAEVEDSFLAYTDAMLNLALLQAQRQQLDLAAATVAELLSLSPERPDALSLQAQIRAAQAAPSEGGSP